MLLKITSMGGQSRAMSLPKSRQELDAFLMDTGIGDDNNFRYKISDIRTGNKTFDASLQNCGNIDELNYIAEFMSKQSSVELDKLAVVVETEKPDNGIDFINLMHNANVYTIFPNINSYIELGEEMAFRLEGIDPESPIGMCVDFDAYGKSYSEAHGGYFANGNYILPPYERVTVYDGDIIP